MLDQKDVTAYGGTMRLGQYECHLRKNSVARKAYGTDIIFERHRHRYEVNNAYIEDLEKAGLVFSGKSPNGKLMEMVELPNLDWFVASQFHPEFKSRPDRAHPLFYGFVKASQSFRNKK